MGWVDALHPVRLGWIRSGVGLPGGFDGTESRAYTVIMTVAVKNKTPVVVPAAALRQAGFKPGQDLEVKASGGVITIIPKVRTVDDEYTPAQRRIIDAQLAEGLADIKAGRVHGPFSTHKAFIASLHKEAAKLSHKKGKRSA